MQYPIFKYSSLSTLNNVDIHRDVGSAALNQTVVARRKHREAVFTMVTGGGKPEEMRLELISCNISGRKLHISRVKKR